MFCYCAESRRLARLLTARYDRELAAAGLSAAQFELLGVLASLREAHGRRLADELAVDPTTLSRNLRALNAAGAVQALPSAADARQMLYSLTAKGRSQWKLAVPLWLAAHAETEASLGSASAPARDTLQQISERLRSAESGR